MLSTLYKTINYLNNIKLESIPGFLLSCVFLGWNGVHIIFSLGLILTFIDGNSIIMLVFNSFRYSSHSIPVYAFAIASFFLIHWFIHCFLEVSFTAKLQGKSLDFREVKAITLNFFVPNLLMVLFIFFIAFTFFLFSTFWYIVSAGFNSNIELGLEQSLFSFLNISIISSIIITTLLSDQILPKMPMFYNFKTSVKSALKDIKADLSRFVIFNLLKVLLIIFSIFVFQSILRYFLLPYFLLLEEKYELTLFFDSGRMFKLNHLLANILKIYIVIFSSLLVFAPIMAPLYVYQRFLLEKWFGY